MDQKGQAFTSGTWGLSKHYSAFASELRHEIVGTTTRASKKVGITREFPFSSHGQRGGFPITTTTTKRGTFFFFPFPCPPFFFFLPLAYKKGARTSYRGGYSKTERKVSNLEALSHNWNKRPEQSRAEQQASMHACKRTQYRPADTNRDTDTSTGSFLFFFFFFLKVMWIVSYTCFFFPFFSVIVMRVGERNKEPTAGERWIDGWMEARMDGRWNVRAPPPPLLV